MDPTPWRTWVPSDERKQVGPEPAKPRKHDTGCSILLRIIRGGTPILDPDQHPVDPLVRWLGGHRTSPHRHGVVHVRSHWRRLPGGPETGPPRRESRVSRFLEWFHGEAGDPGKSRNDPDENGNESWRRFSGGHWARRVREVGRLGSGPGVFATIGARRCSAAGASWPANH